MVTNLVESLNICFKNYQEGTSFSKLLIDDGRIILSLTNQTESLRRFSLGKVVRKSYGKLLLDEEFIRN